MGVAAASGAIDEGADFVQHGCGFEPVGVLRRQAMHRLQAPEELHGEVANALREDQVGLVVFHDRQNGVATLGFDALFHRRALAVVGQHLGQQAVAQAER